MRKIIFGMATLFVVSLFMVSCSSESEVLSSFSKRKYLKKFKEKKVKYENRVEEQDMEMASAKTVSVQELIENQTPELNKPNSKIKPIVLSPKEEKKSVKKTVKEFKNWNKYNRDITDNFIASKEFNNRDYSISNSNRIEEWVLVVLAIFIPPLAVYLYEDAFTGNFWVDLLLTFIFWLPGIIFAFLVMYADVSV